MESSRGVGLVKLLVISSLCYVIIGSNAQQPKLGYQLMDMTRAPQCFDMPPNLECPKNLVNHKVVDFDKDLGVVKRAQAAVSITTDILDFFPGITKECRRNMREYACSNVFSKCLNIKGNGGNVSVSYDFIKTKKACAKVQATCPIAAQAATIYNCTNIMRDPLEFLQCVPVPNVKGDQCPKTNYKYSLPAVRPYPWVTKISNIGIAKAQAQGLPPSCLQKYIHLNCQINPGPICSDDGKLRMYTISKQQCQTFVTNCMNGQSHFKMLCNLLPEKTAKRVALPSVVTNASGK